MKAIRHAGDDGYGQMTDATESVSDGLVRVSGTESAECRRFGCIVGRRHERIAFFGDNLR